jgi:hypothetical protein
MQMDATQELPDGEFDAIAVTGSIQTFDPRYVEALGSHGRLFIVVGNEPAMEAANNLAVRDGPATARAWRIATTVFFLAARPKIEHPTKPLVDTLHLTPETLLPNWFGDIVDYNTSRPTAAPTWNTIR